MHTVTFPFSSSHLKSISPKLYSLPKFVATKCFRHPEREDGKIEEREE